MQTVVARWTGVGLVARLAVLVLTGVAWSVSSLMLALLHPDYWSPVTTTDYVAVYAYTTAWLLTAGSLLILREVAPPDRLLSRTILVVAAGCAIAGIANALEDGLGMRDLGIVYVLGAVVGGFGLLFVAAMLWPSPARSLTFVPAVGALAMMAVTTGGGILALVAWGGFAVILVRERLRSATTSTTA